MPYRRPGLGQERQWGTGLAARLWLTRVVSHPLGFMMQRLSGFVHVDGRCGWRPPDSGADKYLRCVLLLAPPATPSFLLPPLHPSVVFSVMDWAAEGRKSLFDPFWAVASSISFLRLSRCGHMPRVMFGPWAPRSSSLYLEQREGRQVWSDAHFLRRTVQSVGYSCS